MTEGKQPMQADGRDGRGEDVAGNEDPAIAGRPDMQETRDSPEAVTIRMPRAATTMASRVARACRAISETSSLVTSNSENTRTRPPSRIDQRQIGELANSASRSPASS